MLDVNEKLLELGRRLIMTTSMYPHATKHNL
jgi:hypothetical protein